MSDKHFCELDSESDLFGPAVDECYEDDDGKLWVHNGEYASAVNFCPVCGYAQQRESE